MPLELNALGTKGMMSSNTDRLYWSDKHRRLYNGDCRSMYELENESIQMVVTSPPYWGLRKYAGLPDLVWGGNDNCGHQWDITPPRRSRSANDVKNPNSIQAKHEGTLYEAEGGNLCSLCGAWKGQLGLEPTPELYLAHLVEIFREVRRVLRKDGVVFLNIGDSYMSHAGDRSKVGGFQANPNRDRLEAESSMSLKKQTNSILKDKDLCLIPFRLAIALQEDSWWCRSVIIWAKPNPMPESVTDRPTESHEYILMLTKSARYYYDQEAVREPHSRDWGLEGWAQHGYKTTKQNGSARGLIAPERGESTYQNPAGRNLRSVWTFPTQSFSGAHFATYPEKLVEICVKSATPEVGCCSKCGRPWVRITERQNLSTYEEIKRQSGYDYHDSIKLTENRGVAMSGNQKSVGNTLTPDGKVPWYNKADNQTLGWKPQCKCKAPSVPSICLDPFVGSGTTLKVAAELNRRAIGYELSGDYCKLAVERNRQEILL